jgi:hypothetical protein
MYIGDFLTANWWSLGSGHPALDVLDSLDKKINWVELEGRSGD